MNRKWLVGQLETYFQSGGEITPVAIAGYLCSRQNAKPGHRSPGRPPHHDPLTPREWQVLELISDGNSVSQIAEKLEFSIHTAHRHRANIQEKLGMHKTASLVKYYMTHEQGGNNVRR